MEMKIKCAGEYKIVVTRNGEIIKETGWFDNLVLNSGLNFFGSTTNNGIDLNYCFVGVGTSVPTRAQVALDSVVGSINSKTTTITNAGQPTYVSTHTRKYTFAQGTVIGNITEVGVSNTSTGSLFSRALITDTNGNPIALQLIAIDQLTVYYKLKWTPPLTTNIGTVIISGTSYEYEIGLIAAAAFANSESIIPYYLANPSNYGPSTSDLVGPAFLTGSDPYTTSGSTYTKKTYIDGSFYNDFVVTFPITAGNYATGIKSISYRYAYTLANFKILFTTPIMKLNTQTLSLTFRHSWA